MANWSLPTVGSLYTNYTSELDGRFNDLVYGLDPAVTTVTNPKTNSIRWNSASALWEKYNGTSWAALSTQYAINVLSATKWTTGRTVSLTGDVTGTSAAFDGQANLSFAATLATVNSNTGSFGSASAVPIITVNGKGLITAVSTAALGTIATQAASNVSITGGAISATALTLVQSTTAAPTVNGRVEWDSDTFTLMIGDGTTTRTFAPINVAATYTNKTMSTGCTWNGNAVPVANGGTGAADAATARTNLGITYANIGTVPIANGGTGATTATAAFSALISGSTVAVANGGTGLTSYAVGDILYASATGTVGKLADVATGNVLISGGVGVAPSYGKVGLTTHVSGTLAIANGGTGATDAATARTNLGITYANIGTVPIANGGTGATTASAALTALGGLPLSGGTLTGSLLFSGNALRIQGDMSNATQASRFLFQTSTANGNTTVGAIPMGTGTASYFAGYSSSAVANCVVGYLAVTSSGVTLNSTVIGTGTAVPLQLLTTGGSITLTVAGDTLIPGKLVNKQVAKAWGVLNLNTLGAFHSSYGVSSWAVAGTGVLSVTLSTALPDTNACVIVSCERPGIGLSAYIINTTTIGIQSWNTSDGSLVNLGNFDRPRFIVMSN